MRIEIPKSDIVYHNVFNEGIAIDADLHIEFLTFKFSLLCLIGDEVLFDDVETMQFLYHKQVIKVLDIMEKYIGEILFSL